MTGQSESDPITMPTRAPCPTDGSVIASLTLVAQLAGEPGSRVAGPFEAVVQVVTVRVHVAHLPARTRLLAVEVDAQPRVAGQGVRVAVVQAAGVLRSAEDVHHHGPA